MHHHHHQHHHHYASSSSSSSICIIIIIMHHHHSFIGIDGARLYMRTLRQEVMYLLKEAWKLHDDWFIAPSDMRDDSPMMLVSSGMLIVAYEDIDVNDVHGGCGSDDDRVINPVT
jgi:hypothetical protein